jgi:thiamine kinase-like enzyme
MWLLTAGTTFQYLINAKWQNLTKGKASNNYEPIIKFDSLENSSLTIKEYFKSSRNCVIKIEYSEDKKNKSLILKQPNNEEKRYIDSINNEAIFYTLVEKNKIITDRVGDFIYLDNENNVLLFKTDPDFHGVESDLLVDYNYNNFIEEVALTVWKLHQVLEIGDNKQRNSNYLQPSYYLPIFKPNLLIPEARNLLLNKMLSFPSKHLRDLVDRIINVDTNVETVLDEILWNDKDCIIHRDVKYQNFISKSIEKNKFELKLIDWELAAVGDRYWDLAEFCHFLLKSAVYDKGVCEIDHRLDDKNLYKIVLKFLELYFKNANNNQSPDNTFLKKILQLCAVRIIDNFISLIMAGVLVDTNADNEYKRVVVFIDLLYIKNHNSQDFHLNYLPKKING